VYLDNITIHSKTIDEHFKHILEVEEFLICNLRIKQSKCRWISKEEKTKILGYIVWRWSKNEFGQKTGA